LCRNLLAKATGYSNPNDITNKIESLVVSLDPFLKPIAYYAIQCIAQKGKVSSLLSSNTNEQARKEEVLRITNPAIQSSSNTDLLRMLNLKGVSLLKVARYQAAVALYEKAIKMWGGCVPFFVNAVIGMSKIGKFREALNAANEAIVSDRDHYAGWNAKGVALKGLGRFMLSEEAFRTGLDREPSQVSILTNLAEVLRLTGRSRSALELFETRLTDQHSRYLTSLVGARCFWQEGNRQQAEILYEVAISSAPFYDRIWIENERQQCRTAVLDGQKNRLSELSAFDELLIGQHSTLLVRPDGKFYLKLVY
jgi:tetratricopeptide (TPR) repeat protein